MTLFTPVLLSLNVVSRSGRNSGLGRTIRGRWSVTESEGRPRLPGRRVHKGFSVQEVVSLPSLPVRLR